jgi:hypothetical protein
MMVCFIPDVCNEMSSAEQVHSGIHILQVV